MITVRLTEQQAKVCQFAIALLKGVIDNDDDLSVKTWVSAHALAGIDEQDKILAEPVETDFVALVTAFNPPDPATELEKGLTALDTVQKALKESGIGQVQIEKEETRGDGQP